MKLARASIFGAAALVAAASAAHAQDEAQAPIPFEGGTLTITETEDLDKVLAFDGEELARNYVVLYDKTVEVNGTRVALFAVGDGGNQCGPAEVIVWKGKDGEIQTEAVGEDCGAPPAAISDSSIYFVPYLLPGDTNNVQQWSPDTGLEVVGSIAYSPQPGTGWQDLDPAKFEYMIDSMKNAAVYDAAQKLLGDHVLDVVTGLQTGGTTETTPSGIYYASGCVPHACGGADAFMAIEPKSQKLYFAQEGDSPQPSTWPDFGTWPAEIKELMSKALLEPAQ
jgi:hypothetical protein